MGQKSGPGKQPAEQVVKAIRRATRRQFSAEEKIRIVLSGLRGEDSIAELCRREGIVENLYYRWSKEFLEAGKKHLAGDTVRAATEGHWCTAPGYVAFDILRLDGADLRPLPLGERRRRLQGILPKGSPIVSRGEGARTLRADA